MTRYGFIAAGVLAASLLAMTSVQAADTPRIGVVNIGEVIAKSQAGQAASQSLKPVAERIQKDLSDRRAKLGALKTELDKADKKSANYQQLLKNYESGVSDYQQFVAQNQDAFNQNRQALLQPIEQELGKVLQQYAQDNHYDILLTEDAAGAVYASPKYNVTQGVIAALDKEWATSHKSTPAGKSGG
ncbi:MAG: OmpH family outer membrane protein [Gammaproteobacteria bacterium]